MNQRCRQISLPYIFHTVNFDFSSAGFRQLEVIARSHIARYVKVLHYEASEIVDPRTFHKRSSSSAADF